MVPKCAFRVAENKLWHLELPGMKMFLWIVALICYSAVVAWAGDERDGTWWRQQTQYVRVIYVLGAIDGMASGSFVASASGSEAMQEYEQRVIRLIGRSRAGQLSEGVDVFYRDFRNRSILASNALCIVAAQIGGMPDKEVAAWTEVFRRSAHENRDIPSAPPPRGPTVTVPKHRGD
jgi:hypothetical protein